MLHTFINADVFNISTTFEPAQNADVISKTPCVNDKPFFVLKTMNTGSHCTLPHIFHLNPVWSSSAYHPWIIIALMYLYSPKKFELLILSSQH